MPPRPKRRHCVLFTKRPSRNILTDIGNGTLCATVRSRPTSVLPTLLTMTQEYPRSTAGYSLQYRKAKFVRGHPISTAPIRVITKRQARPSRAGEAKHLFGLFERDHCCHDAGSLEESLGEARWLREGSPRHCPSISTRCVINVVVDIHLLMFLRLQRQRMWLRLSEDLHIHDVFLLSMTVITKVPDRRVSRVKHCDVGRSQLLGQARG